MTTVNLENAIYNIDSAGHGHVLAEKFEAKPGAELTIEGIGDLESWWEKPKVYRTDSIEISPDGIVVNGRALVGSPANQAARVLGRRSAQALIEECGEGFNGTWVRFESEPVPDTDPDAHDKKPKKPGAKKQEAGSGKAATGK